MREVFEGLKINVVDALVDEIGQSQDDIKYRSDIVEVLIALNKFLDYDLFERTLFDEKCSEYLSLSNINSDNLIKMRKVVLYRLNNVLISSNDEFVKNEMITVLDSFFNSYVHESENNKCLVKKI